MTVSELLAVIDDKITSNGLGQITATKMREVLHDITNNIATSVAGRRGDVTLSASDISDLSTLLALKAPLASPAFSGTPTAATAAPGTNTTQLATTAFVTGSLLAPGGWGGSCIVDTYDGEGEWTWVKRAGAVMVDVIIFPPGYGGASGGTYPSVGTRLPSGGSAGGVWRYRFDGRFGASDVPDSLTVENGAPGSGGSAVSTSDTEGNGGGAPGVSSFGDLLVANVDINRDDPFYSFDSNSLPTGGSGGGINATFDDTNYTLVDYAAGANSHVQGQNSRSTRVSIGGTSEGQSGSDGADAPVALQWGVGGAGGAGSMSGAAGHGGHGGIPGAPGGGGGAAVNGQTSGAGGTGGQGRIIVVTHFLAGSPGSRGAWDASTNTPTIPEPSETNLGWFYIVSNPVGSDHGYEFVPDVSFAIGDFIISDGTAWTKISNGPILRESVWLDAGSFVPRGTDGATTETTETSTYKVMSDRFAFDKDTSEFAQVRIRLPDEWDHGTINCKIHWMTSGEGDVKWGVSAMACRDNVSIDAAFGTEVTVVDTYPSGVDDLCITSATGPITPSGSPASGDLLWIQVRRLADDGADTLDNDAFLLGIEIQFTTTQKGSPAW